jgi:hypothetical protein
VANAPVSVQKPFSGYSSATLPLVIGEKVQAEKCNVNSNREKRKWLI